MQVVESAWRCVAVLSIATVAGFGWSPSPVSEVLLIYDSRKKDGVGAR